MRCRSIVLAFITSVLFVSAIAAPPAVTIKEWDLPTPNSRPHDPAIAPDGSLWYTGQMANKLEQEVFEQYANPFRRWGGQEHCRYHGGQSLYCVQRSE